MAIAAPQGPRHIEAISSTGVGSPVFTEHTHQCLPRSLTWTWAGCRRLPSRSKMKRVGAWAPPTPRSQEPWPLTPGVLVRGGGQPGAVPLKRWVIPGPSFLSRLH